MGLKVLPPPPTTGITSRPVGLRPQEKRGEEEEETQDGALMIFCPRRGFSQPTQTNRELLFEKGRDTFYVNCEKGVKNKPLPRK